MITEKDILETVAVYQDCPCENCAWKRELGLDLVRLRKWHDAVKAKAQPVRSESGTVFHYLVPASAMKED